MADQEQLAILRQGAEIWNQWRREHPDIEANLSGANLTRANLTRAKLSGADLSGADLYEADLSGADLREAFLSEATLYGATLREATLREATLRSVTLYKANLSLADLTGAIVGYVVFGRVDLSTVKGLETVRHTAPSTIGIDMIYASHGNIPEAFLKGAGVQESFITYMRSLVVQPIDYYTCFISYSSHDQEFANRLYADQQREKVRCWFAPEDLKIGDKLRPRIDESIRVYDKLLLVLSEHSITSNWVAYEVERALNKEPEGIPNVLFPLRVDNAVMTANAGWADDIRRTRHIGDFTHWKHHDEYQKAFTRLLRDLKAETTR